MNSDLLNLIFSSYLRNPFSFTFPLRQKDPGNKVNMILWSTTGSTLCVVEWLKYSNGKNSTSLYYPLQRLYNIYLRSLIVIVILPHIGMSVISIQFQHITETSFGPIRIVNWLDGIMDQRSKSAGLFFRQRWVDDTSSSSKGSRQTQSAFKELEVLPPPLPPFHIPPHIRKFSIACAFSSDGWPHWIYRMCIHGTQIFVSSRLFQRKDEEKDNIAESETGLMSNFETTTESCSALQNVPYKSKLLKMFKKYFHCT